MVFELITYGDIAQTLAKRLKALRLQKKWKRSTLAQRSGVSGASLRRFEQTACISLENFLKLLSALGRFDEMEQLLHSQVAKTIDDLESKNQKLPKRSSI